MTPEELVELGHFRRADALLESFINQHPASGQAAWLLARAKAGLGDLDAALKLAETALATDPDNAAYHLQIAAVSGRMAEKASMFKQLALARRAKKELDTAVALDARNTDAQWGLMMYYFAAPSFIGGDKLKSAQIGGEIARTVPDRGLFYEARLAHEMKEHAREEPLYRESALANPLLFETAEALAAYYIDEKPDLIKAEIWACQAVHATPTRAQGWAILARLHAMAGCWTEAMDIAARAEAIDPDDLMPYYAIAITTNAKSEQLGLAEQVLRKYLTKPPEGLEPSAANAHWQLGSILEKLGRKSDAISELELAVAQDPALEAARSDLKRLRAEARR